MDYEFLKTEYLEKRKSITRIASETGVTDSKVYYWLHKYGLDHKGTRSNAVVDETKFSTGNPMFCYFAGLILTDGHIDYKNNRVTVSTKNQGSERVYNALAADFGASAPIYKERRGMYALCIHSVSLLNKLSSLGIYGHKIQRSFDREIADYLDEDCFRMFIRGIFDGDGSIRKSGGEVRMACKSRSLIENLVYYANTRLHDTYKIQSCGNQRGKDLYSGITLHKKDSEMFLHWLYDGFSDIRFDDKYARYALHYL